VEILDMNENIIIDIARQTLWLILKVSAPMLITSLVVGLLVSVFQTITSIQEQTLTFVPKLIAVFLVIMIFGNWILTEVRDFAVELITNFGYYIKS
jgi:flagellar biosynthetic protein FliQ